LQIRCERDTRPATFKRRSRPADLWGSRRTRPEAGTKGIQRRHPHVTDSDHAPCSPRQGSSPPRLSLGLLGALAAPAATHAATIGPATIDGVDSVSYVADPGEANRLVVQPGPGGTVSFVDPGATIVPLGATCVSISAHEAQRAAGLVPALNLSLGDGDDSATVDANKPGVLSGDTGNDVLTGGDGDEALLGGDGDDVLEGRGGADLLSGEAGHDRVTYGGRTAPVTVDLATTTTDREGEAGEHDTVASDVERVTGGAGNDRIVGSAGANQLDGGPGDDTSGTQFDPVVVRALCAEVDAARELPQTAAA
jgi:hypothetical protein